MRFTSLFALASLPLAFSAAGCASSDDGASPPGAPNGTQDGTDPGSGSSGGAGGSCTSQPFAPAPLETGESLVDLAVGGQDAWLLLQTRDGALAVQKAGGERHVLASKDATGAAIASRSDGTVCALWGTGSGDDAVVRTACSPAFEAVDTGVKMPMSRQYPVAFRDDGAGGAAVLFAKSNSLDGVARRGLDGPWRDAALMESSISFAGGPRALSGAADGAPLCFVINGTIAVERWNRSGSANDIGHLKMESRTTFYTDLGCGVAAAGEAIGVFAVGGGKATFATSASPFDPDLDEAPLDASDVVDFSFAATSSAFHAVYTTPAGAFRARRAASGGVPEVSPVALPGAAKPAGPVALAFDRAGAEHLAVQTASEVLYARTCAPK